VSGDERSPPRRVSPPPLFGRCTKCPPRSLFPLVCSLGLALAAPENTTAVEVTAFFGKVSIDLNGFTIQGVTICGAGPTNPAVCDPLGSGEGISAGSNTRVHNGIVAHMGSDGIHRGSGRVEDVVVFMNGGGDGVHGSDGVSVPAVTATWNHRNGISSSSPAGFATASPCIED
jgi:hypothetical protein